MGRPILGEPAKEIAGVLSGIRGRGRPDYDHLAGQPQLQVSRP